MRRFLRWATAAALGTVLVLTGATAAPATPALGDLTVNDANGNASTVARTLDGRPVTDATTAAEVAAFWTPARMAAAIDMTLGVNTPEPANPTRTKAAPTGPPGSVAPAAPTVRTSGALTPDVAGTTDVSTLQVTESATVGKVYFVVPDGRLGSCSAAAVNSPKGRLVMTAGHCVVDPALGGWYSNWQFVPRYRNGSRPFGTWTARLLTSRTAWINNRDVNQDMGIAIMNNNASNQTIVSVVGGNGLRWNWGYEVNVTILGYPAEPPYTGELQYYCQGTTWHGHEQQVRAWCSMTGGSSGGPWLQDYDNSTGLGYINSVVSHRHGDPDQMDGPYFADNIKSLYDYAEDLT